MDAHADHYAELLISAKAGHIGSDVTPDAFANAVWSFARALAARRAQLAVEDIEELRKSHKIPASVPTEPPGEQLSPAQGSPISAGQTSGEVIDAELAPFLEATKELRGHQTRARRCQVESFPDPDSGAVRCPDPAVESVGVALLCFAHARIEFAYIAQESGIEAARAESANFSTKEDEHAAAERGKDCAFPSSDGGQGVLRHAAEGGNHHVDPAGGFDGREPAGRRGHGGPDGVRTAAGPASVEPRLAGNDPGGDDGPAAAQGDLVQRHAQAGLLELASEGLNAEDVLLVRRAVQHLLTFRPAKVSVTGFQVDFGMPYATADRLMALLRTTRTIGRPDDNDGSLGPVLWIRGPEAPSEASRGGIAPAAPEDGAQPRVEVAGHAAESVAQEAASPVQPVQEVKHEEPLVEEQADTKRSDCSAPGAPGSSGTAPQTGKRGRKTKRESVSKSAAGLTCGGTDCSDDGKTLKHHVGDPTCSQYGPRDASELAAKYEGTP